MYHTGEDIIDNIFQPNTKENCHSFSCSHLLRQPLAATCSQPLAATCSHRLKQTLAATCSYWQPLAATCSCSHLAATWQPLPDTCPKWLQQVAAKWLLEQVAAKWLQVAASGCFFEIAHLLRPQWSVRFRGFAWTIPLEAPKSFSFQTKFSWPFNPMSTSKANSSGDKVLS